jgi:subtilisin family serine protease
MLNKPRSRQIINKILIITPLVLILFFGVVIYINSLTSVTYNETASASDRFVAVEETNNLSSDILVDKDEAERKSSLQRSVLTLPENINDEERSKILETIGNDGLNDGNTIQTDPETAKQIIEIIENKEVLVEDDTIFTISAQQIPWGITQIGADQAWTQVSAEDVVVAVIDTGISRSHEDLTGRVIRGYDFANDDDNPEDDNGHGTHVAGIISAIDNSIGIVGTSPETKLIPIKVLDNSGSGYLSNVVKGINYAVDNGADIINMSLGANTDSIILQRAIKRATDAGVIVVAAAGNSNADQCAFPARYNNVICVGATTISNKVASYSNRNVDIAAPGQSIKSTFLNSQYTTLSGTSMATPFVSGTLALGRTACPECSNTQLNRYLNSTGVDLGDPGKDELFGNGLIDTANMVNTILQDQFDSPSNNSSNANSDNSASRDNNDSATTSSTNTVPLPIEEGNQTNNTNNREQRTDESESVNRSNSAVSRRSITTPPSDNIQNGDNITNNENIPTSVKYSIQVTFEGDVDRIEKDNTSNDVERITLKGSNDIELTLSITPEINQRDLRQFTWYLDGVERGKSTQSRTRAQIEFDDLTANQYTLKVVAIYSDGSFDIKNMVLDLTKLTIGRNPDNSNSFDQQREEELKRSTENADNVLFWFRR